MFDSLTEYRRQHCGYLVHPYQLPSWPPPVDQWYTSVIQPKCTFEQAATDRCSITASRMFGDGYIKTGGRRNSASSALKTNYDEIDRSVKRTLQTPHSAIRNQMVKGVNDVTRDYLFGRRDYAVD